MADLSDAEPGLDVLYVADLSLGVRKFSKVSGTWQSNGVVGSGADEYRGLTGTVNGSTVTLFATRHGGTTPIGGGELVRIPDTNGHGQSFSASATVIATAGANTAFRGVAYVQTTPVLPCWPADFIVNAQDVACRGFAGEPQNGVVQFSMPSQSGVNRVIVGGRLTVKNGSALPMTIEITPPGAEVPIVSVGRFGNPSQFFTDPQGRCTSDWRGLAIDLNDVYDAGPGQWQVRFYNAPDASVDNEVVFENLCLSFDYLLCRPDFNQSGSVTVQDIFDFLAAWFAVNPTADFNSTAGVTVQDIFDFLAAWFAGC